MEHRFKLLAFDLDGTLVNSLGMIEAALNKALAAEGLGAISGPTLREPIGLPLEDCVRYWLESAGTSDAQATASQVERVSLAYRQYFTDLRTSGSFAEPMFPGVQKTLDGLMAAGVFMAIVTGKDLPGLLRVVEHHGFEKYFADNLNTPTHFAGKPSPDMVYGAAEKAMQELDDTVVIGDTTFDIQMAVNAGVKSVGVSYGNHSVERLLAAGADVIIDQFDELPAALAKIS